ncbi:hypothetical protein [Methylobacterium marchantiae]|uniref:Uncharacterized protein n=1 Tax=Methylobacterium marchantiae TaxID=600331 RepID=A0ABW3WYJ3_9HYPH
MPTLTKNSLATPPKSVRTRRAGHDPVTFASEGGAFMTGGSYHRVLSHAVLTARDGRLRFGAV